MPFITVQIAKGHSIEKKRQLVKALTDTLVDTLGSKPECITIHIDEFERDNWAVGGTLHSDKHGGRHVEKGV
ncbi:tautomerase family protein [Calothrix sp. 336/3]|uniref:tautomerase family protein n=1 Tax=Calothrix sp. 336/3 TaxID=1337936 RepID=UPI0004E2FAE3|nr:4-oxalocrotonate tautomerase family protein [Calothrix sp. 336/3]AKG23775.1 4-oxalocrotonate tautomerase [Calothrix sp. 336/3]